MIPYNFVRGEYSGSMADTLENLKKKLKEPHGLFSNFYSMITQVL